MNIWFYSDPHFDHKNIIKYDGRPFNSVEEMNNALIERYNSIVKPEDIVVWVGDCFLGRTQNAKDIMKILNGKKVLIRGNHDKRRTQMLNLGFDWVCESMCLNIAKELVNVSHYPYHPTWLQRLFRKVDVRKLHKRLKNDGKWLIHGHTHLGYGKKALQGRQINVGCMFWGYKPVSITTIEQIIQTGGKLNEANYLQTNNNCGASRN